MIITPLTVGPFQENCYLVADDTRGVSAVVDPGAEPEKIIEMIERSGTTLQGIWITHGHVDHVGAIAAVKRKWNVPVSLHPLDLQVYSLAGKSAEIYGIPFEEPPAPDAEFAEGQSLTLGGLTFEVNHRPGHAPGHVVMHGHGIALVGDCLFAGSIGRTDLPFSKPSDLAASLKQIAQLPPETIIYPGHGPSTTIGEELESNPFLNGSARIVAS
ncbi:MAG TPA: MBL fold metallo-hydrolase [Longimicrobiales bacterium]|nr:MBL fold metallo-hydrolase [Longimicrobiales bacterium]